MIIKPRILVIGGNLPHTSFGRITHQIVSGLSSTYEVHQLCISDLTLEQKNNPLFHEVSSIRDIHGKSKLAQILVELKPSVLFIYSTILGLSRYLDLVHEIAPKLKVIAYCAIENHIVRRRNFILPLCRLNQLVVFSEFAKKEFENVFEELKLMENMPEISVIPHGIDTDNFFPIKHIHIPDYKLDDIRSYSRKIAFGNIDYQNSFIVLNRNIIQSRKRIDITMRAFEIFIQRKPKNIFLCLHPGKSIFEKRGIRKMAIKYNIEDRIIFELQHNSITCKDNFLNHVYNSCDVGVNTSGGEGWGLVSFEHAATRAAQIVPNHSSCTELWGNFAEMIESKQISVQDDLMHQMNYVLAEDVAKKLDTLYFDKSLLTKVSNACFNNAIDNKFKWSSVNQRWLKLFEKII